MLTDLRVKLRTRRSSISSCGFQDFLPQTKQFFAFLDNSSILKAVIAELLARNQKSVMEVQNMPAHQRQSGRVYGATAEEAATVGYVTWREFSNQAQYHGFHSHALGGGDFDKTSAVFKDWYVEPLFNYLDETLDDANIVLALLIRYKQKVEWYRKGDVLKQYGSDTSRGEKNLKWHMFEFLFDQGLPFHIEPASASGEPDVVFIEDSKHPFPGEVKVFDPERGKSAPNVREGFSQTYRYCLDYNEPLGYLIVFNVSKKQLSVEIPSKPDGIPRFELNHKTIFLVVINLYDKGTASTLGVVETVTITEAELVREVEESARSKG